MSSAHEFALFCPTLPDNGLIVDPTLIRRIHSILRLMPGDTLTLFSHEWWMRCVIGELREKSLSIVSQERHSIQPLKPHITLVLPFLERAALEEAVRAATVLGVHRVVLVRTQKSAPIVFSPALHERLTRVMIAAAEQSKQFALPIVSEAKDLAAMRMDAGERALLFHPAGTQSKVIIDTLSDNVSLTVYIGPAGDLTESEQVFLESKGVERVALTPTILRSEDSIMVGIGMLRSVLRSTQL